MSKLAIGIDLGTSNSCVAAVFGDKPEVLTNAEGDTTQASVVCFPQFAPVLVGNVAKKSILLHPERTVHSAKRLMGRQFSSLEVQQARQRHAYPISEGANGAIRIDIDPMQLSPPEIAAMVLKEMKRIAEAFLGREVTAAVITVPAYFNDNQRQATRDAGAIAGLEVLRIVNEPTAAALAYGFGKKLQQRLAVYDLGGGTFDVSVLEIGTDVFEVLGTAGDTYLGGNDFDQAIVDYLLKCFHDTSGIDIRSSSEAMVQLKEAAEQAKIDLSTQPAAHINILQLFSGPDGKTYDLDAKLTAQDFARLSMSLLQRTFKVCDEALAAAGMTAGDLDAVILVGGPTRLPVVRQAVAHYFQKQPIVGINPDHVVAMGAALQANALLNAGPTPMLLDVTPLSLRIGTVGGYAETIIEKNTPVPIDSSREFTTVRDNQDRVMVKVFQGESREQAKCTLLGEFEFHGITPAPRGDVTINVTFEIDADGIVNVSAKDMQSDRQASTTIRLSSGLTAADIAAGKKRHAEVMSSEGMEIEPL